MNAMETKTIPCAIYTRKSHAEGLEQKFNSLDAQREAVEKYIESQRGEGLAALPDRYDDGGFTGGNTDRPALQRLMEDVRAGKVGAICVYKVDRLSRSLADFMKLMEVLEKHGVSFISVTQHFNTNTSMGRLILNVLLSFAQFEREVISERIRDKIALSKAKGKNMGGVPPLGYDVVDHKLVINPAEAAAVRDIFARFVECGSITQVVTALKKRGVRTKAWTTVKGRVRPGKVITKQCLYRLLGNRKYLGEIPHRDKVYPGEHEAIVDRGLWDKAHAILSVHRRERAAATRPAAPDLLKGILHCGHCGHAMVRSYTKKRSGRMYRYYLCTTALRQGYAACPIGSLATGEIEAQVVARVRRHLANPVVIGRAAEKARHEAAAAGVDPFDPGAVAQRAADLESAWEHLFPAEQARLARLLVWTVHVRNEGLRIAYREAGFAALAGELAGGNTAPPSRPARGGGGFAEASPLEKEGYGEFVPLRITRRSGRKVIVAAPEPPADGWRLTTDGTATASMAGGVGGASVVGRQPSAGLPSPLVKAIARGFRYRAMMDAGEGDSQEALAAKLGVSRSYMSRMIRLTLAPDIVEAIVDGREPPGLSVETLTRGDYPGDWPGQRQALGFPALGQEDERPAPPGS